MYNVQKKDKQKFYKSKELVHVGNYKRVSNPLCEICERNRLIITMYEVGYIQDIDELAFRGTKDIVKSFGAWLRYL